MFSCTPWQPGELRALRLNWIYPTMILEWTVGDFSRYFATICPRRTRAKLAGQWHWPSWNKSSRFDVENNGGQLFASARPFPQTNIHFIRELKFALALPRQTPTPAIRPTIRK
jgi:hypothetical protein